MDASSRLLRIIGWVYVVVGLGLLLSFIPGPISFQGEMVRDVLVKNQLILVPYNVLALSFERATVCHGALFGACELKPGLNEFIPWILGSLVVLLIGFLLLVTAKSQTRNRSFLRASIVMLCILVYLSNFYFTTPLGYENSGIFFDTTSFPLALLILLILIFSDWKISRFK